MKICHMTTFFGHQSFGCDATYVDPLSRAQLRLGHEARCFLCSITSGKPPQLWRFSPMMRKNLQLLNGLIFPSKSAMQANSDCKAESVRTLWSEKTHVDLYFKFVNRVSSVNQDRYIAEGSR